MAGCDQAGPQTAVATSQAGHPSHLLARTGGVLACRAQLGDRLLQLPLQMRAVAGQLGAGVALHLHCRPGGCQLCGQPVQLGLHLGSLGCCLLMGTRGEGGKGLAGSSAQAAPLALAEALRDPQWWW